MARASLQELLLDYEDYLRTRKIPQWNAGNPRYDPMLKLTRGNSEVAFFLSQRGFKEEMYRARLQSRNNNNS